MSCDIDETKGQYVSTMDIPISFRQKDINNMVNTNL